MVWVDKVGSSRDWLAFLFGRLWDEEVVEAPWPDPQPRTLYGIDTNWHPLARIPQSFLQAVAATPGAGLFHSDEWLVEDYNVYRHFAFVMRVHHARGIDGDGILTLPLGWPNGGQGTGRGEPASRRPNSWFFAGSLVSSRPAMMAAMKRLVPGGDCTAYAPGFRNPKPLSQDAFKAKLGSSVFVPATMGNVVLETWRFYEALEAGCIPLLERRPTLDYYRSRLGAHPVPTFRTWNAAARFAANLMREPEKLDRLQGEIADWWDAYKPRVAQDAEAYVRAGLEDRYRSSLTAWSFPTGLRRDVWQYSELLRHQSAGTVLARIRKAVGRGSLRRDMSHLDTPS